MGGSFPFANSVWNVSYFQKEKMRTFEKINDYLEKALEYINRDCSVGLKPTGKNVLAIAQMIQREKLNKEKRKK